jgi:hypothetical protein
MNKQLSTEVTRWKERLDDRPRPESNIPFFDASASGEYDNPRTPIAGL